MSLKTKLLDDIKTTMKARDSKKLEVLRFVNAQIKNKEIENRPNELKEEEVLQIFKKFVKQRKESMDQFEKAKRQDLVDAEVYSLSVIEEYLPEMLSSEDLKKVVEEVIAESGASSMKEMGAVMQKVLAKTGGLADGKMVSTLVKELLS